MQLWLAMLQALNFLTDRYLVKRDPADISIDDMARAKNQTVEWNGGRSLGSASAVRVSAACQCALSFRVAA